MEEIQCVDDLERVFAVGEEILCSDGCNTCTCMEDGTYTQTKMFCPGNRLCRYGDNILKSGESVVCDDGCNTCECSDGNILQTLMLCGKIHVLKFAHKK